jgi:hypothetical protein
MTRRDDEQQALRLLRETGDAIVAGVERELPGWVQREVGRILDAWGRLDTLTRTRAEQQAETAGAEAACRVGAGLRALLAEDPARQRTTPLEIVRTASREPTAVLAAAGIPPVARDEFDERAWPDDRYGLVPRDLGELGDPELAPLHLAWGLAKSRVLRSRTDR